MVWNRNTNFFRWLNDTLPTDWVFIIFTFPLTPITIIVHNQEKAGKISNKKAATAKAAAKNSLTANDYTFNSRTSEQQSLISENET